MAINKRVLCRGSLSGVQQKTAGRLNVSNFIRAFAGIFPRAPYINVICHFAFDKKVGGTAVIKV